MSQWSQLLLLVGEGLKNTRRRQGSYPSSLFLALNFLFSIHSQLYNPLLRGFYARLYIQPRVHVHSLTHPGLDINTDLLEFPDSIFFLSPPQNRFQSRDITVSGIYWAFVFLSPPRTRCQSRDIKVSRITTPSSSSHYGGLNVNSETF